MFAILRKPNLKRDKLMILLNHKSPIYSKPPKEKIGAVVGLSIFILYRLCIKAAASVNVCIDSIGYWFCLLLNYIV